MANPEWKTVVALDQATRDEIKEIAAALEDDLNAARIPGNRPEAETHEDRLRALEAAVTVLLHALIGNPINGGKP